MRVSFSTALMCLSNSSELYPSRNRCLHSFQWCSKCLQSCSKCLQWCSKCLQWCSKCLQWCSKCLQWCSKCLQWCSKCLQSCSKCFDMAQIRLILSAWLYRILSFNDFECSESIWRKIKAFSIYFGVIFVVLDIHLCIQKRNTGFWNFVLIFNWVVFWI